MTKETILLIEDERSLVEVLTYNLTREGFDVISALDGQEGLRRAAAALPDLIILDLMLPIIDGLQVCRELRAEPRIRNTRILMLTAKSEELDEIIGFNMGADDYVTKPFKLQPLIHRIKALLRRPIDSREEGDVIALKGLQIDRLNHTATLDGVELLLTPTEFRLLWTLIRRPGRPYSRLELMDICRGEDANALERTIDVHVRSLRQKLANHAKLIETVRGVGYRFQPESVGAT
jgi:two-component system phosphate regulon response regulator PhoB